MNFSQLDDFSENEYCNVRTTIISNCRFHENDYTFDP